MQMGGNTSSGGEDENEVAAAVEALQRELVFCPTADPHGVVRQRPSRGW